MTSSAKIAFVTGANKGIGLEVARQLARGGSTVWMGACDAGRGQEAAGRLKAEGFDVRAIVLDLNDRETIARAAATVEAEAGRLDILVNNAGIGAPGDGPPSEASLEAVESTMRTNFIGTLAVTQAMLPLLRKAPAARIVNVSSGLGSLTLHGDPGWEYARVKILGYCASKAALNMLTVQLAWELRDTAIKVNSADPGYTATDMNQHQGPQTVEEGAEEAVRLALLAEDGPTGGFFDRKGSNPW